MSERVRLHHVFLPTSCECTLTPPLPLRFFQPLPAQTSCLKCSTEEDAGYGTGYSSPEGAATCSRCTAGYCRDNSGRCQACPDGADCSTEGSTLEGLILLPGYWRTDSTSWELLQCHYPDACLGGNDTNRYCDPDGYVQTFYCNVCLEVCPRPL